MAGVGICERDIDGSAVLAVQTTRAWREEHVSAMRSRRYSLRLPATCLFGGTCNPTHEPVSNTEGFGTKAETYATALIGPFVVNSAPVDRMLPLDTSVGWKSKNS